MWAWWFREGVFGQGFTGVVCLSFPVASAAVRFGAVVLLFAVTPIVRVFCVFGLVLGDLFWLTEVALLYVVAICVPSSRCHVSHAIVAFPGHTHLLFEVWRGIRYNITHISLLFLTIQETIRPAYAIYGYYI